MLPDRAVELVGTDSNPGSIRWCRENIAEIDFCENGPDPPLGFSPKSFDALYALSVLTHLSEEGHFRWIRELLRVVKDSGIVIFSTHGDACAGKLLAEERRRYEAGELVVRAGAAEGQKSFAAYHPPQFVRARLLADAEVLTFLPSPQLHDMIQDVWVVRKKV
jgi:SAM-dependent methyltransferase